MQSRKKSLYIFFTKLILQMTEQFNVNEMFLKIYFCWFFFYNVKYTNIYTRHRHSAEPRVKLRDIILN